MASGQARSGDSLGALQVLQGVFEVGDLDDLDVVGHTQGSLLVVGRS